MAGEPQNPVENTGSSEPSGAAGRLVFLKPRLTGDRFRDHSIPLEFLKDLAVVEEMVIEVAKWRFLQAHPDRKRSPRGFADGVSLILTGVEDGSAVPVISLVMAGATLFPPENQTFFLEARDAIVSAIGVAEAEQTSAILEHLPERALSYFDRIGRSLRSGEAIEFDRSAGGGPARLTKASRRRLVLASATTQNLTEETTIRGLVPEADQDQLSFEIQLQDGRKIPAPLSDPHIEAILEAFNGYRQGVRIALQGIGRTTRTGRLEKIESIERVSVLDPLDVQSRLDELRALQDGWLEGRGHALSVAGLEWLSAAFDAYFPDDLPLPFLFPTEDGDVRAEWPLQQVEASMHIDLVDRSAEWHALDMTHDTEACETLDLGNAEGWNRLAILIRSPVGGSE